MGESKENIGQTVKRDLEVNGLYMNSIYTVGNYGVI